MSDTIISLYCTKTVYTMQYQSIRQNNVHAKCNNSRHWTYPTCNGNCFLDALYQWRGLNCFVARWIQYSLPLQLEQLLSENDVPSLRENNSIILTWLMAKLRHLPIKLLKLIWMLHSNTCLTIQNKDLNVFKFKMLLPS